MTVKNGTATTNTDGSAAPGGQGGAGSSGAAEGEGQNGSPPPEGDGNTSNDSLDESALDDKAKAYIAKLRKENAKYRTAARTNENLLNDTRTRLSQLAGGEPDGNEAPEVQIERLSTHVGALEFERALLELAVDRGIDKSGMNYFRFLVADATSQLGEGEELSDEALEAISSEVQAKTARNTTSSVGAGSGTKPPPAPGDQGAITVQKFAKMSMIEKTQLFQKNEPLYRQLFDEAREKKLLI